MPTARSTVVVVAGEAADEVLRGLAPLPNVRAASLKDAEPDAVGGFVASAQTSYVVHDADPLGHVAHAWVEFFEDQATLGSLDVEIDDAVRALAGGPGLPDYYLVLDPEAMPGTWRHWWLGVLASRAPSRVLPVAPHVHAVRQQLRRLPTGRPWPDPARWLREVRTDVPDHVGRLRERSA
jgi:hypothetical protein